jgi:hypothetical protein
MVQRGPTLIKSLSSWLASLPYSESGPPAEIMDRIGASMGNPLALALGVGITQAGKSADQYVWNCASPSRQAHAFTQRAA